MADSNDHHHHHQHRPHRLSLPQRTATFTQSGSLQSARAYPQYPYTPTPTPTPSKLKHGGSSSIFCSNKNGGNSSSFSFLLLVLLSLRSLYSLHPFLISASQSFSLFPFAFLVSLFSFLVLFLFSAFSFFPSKDRNLRFFSINAKSSTRQQPIFSLSLTTPSQRRHLLTKSVLLALVLLLRFQALRYCGTAAMILAEFSGNVAARVVSDKSSITPTSRRYRKYGLGFSALVTGLFLLSISWDREKCFPLSSSNGNGVFGLLRVDNRGNDKQHDVSDCVRVLPMLLPFLSGFLGCYEKTVSMNWGTIWQLGHKRVRLITFFFTSLMLFVPTVISVMIFDQPGDGSNDTNNSVGGGGGGLSWPLANIVLFGVLLSENYYFSDDKVVTSSAKDFQREFLVTFVCTVVLELFYFPELSLGGVLLCGFLFWIAVRELDPSYVELGLDSSDSLASSMMKPIRHILSERKSRKIALFLMINTGYMVVEFVSGFMSNSLGLISDACHMLFDCAALAIGLYASYASRLPANGQFNYGRGRFEVLSGYVNAVFLVLVGALIVLESIERILDPQEISTNSLLTVSIGGLLVNIVGLIFFHEEHHHAHGGTGSCSHSHAHSPSHSHSHSHSHSPSPDGKPSVLEKKCTDHHGHCHHDGSDHADKFEGDHGHHHHDHGRAHDNHDHDHGHHHHSRDHNNQDHHQEHGHHHHNHEHNHQDHNHKHGHQQHHELEVHTVVSKERQAGEPQGQQSHRHIDHNMEGIFLHVLADTLGSVGVVVSTLLIKYKGWVVSDPACSIFISVLIVSSVMPLLRNSAEILLQRVPRAHEQDLREALGTVMKLKGVCRIQQFHAWSLTNTEVVGTLHLHVSEEIDKGSTKAQVTQLLQDAGVGDVTVQVECIKSN